MPTCRNSPGSSRRFVLLVQAIAELRTDFFPSSVFSNVVPIPADGALDESTPRSSDRFDDIPHEAGFFGFGASVRIPFEILPDQDTETTVPNGIVIFTAPAAQNGVRIGFKVRREFDLVTSPRGLLYRRVLSRCGRSGSRGITGRTHGAK